MTVILGWANEGWGEDPWGGALIGGSQFQGATALRENVIRCFFSSAPFFSGLLESTDASVPTHWAVAAVDGTTGLDGTACRPVGVLFATVGSDPGSIDLTLDRPMTPAPSLYTVTASGLVTSDTLTPIPQTTVQLIGLYRRIEPPSITTAASPTRDIANPQTLSALPGTSPLPPSVLLLGTFVTDDTGDYATDHGQVSYKKRILRMGLTNPGGFAHLPGFGVGIPSYGKRLASPAIRNRLASAWQKQILQDPDTLDATVTTSTPADAPNLCFFLVTARLKGGQGMRIQVPFPIS